MDNFDPTPDPQSTDAPFDGSPIDLSAPPGGDFEYTPDQPGPRVWTALLLPVITFAAMLVVSTVSFLVVLFGGAAMLGDTVSITPGNEDAMMAQFERYASSVTGFAITLIPTQIVVGGAAVMAAMMSRERWMRRLNINTDVSPSMWVLMPFLLAGTLAMGLMSDLIAQYMMENVYKSEHLEVLARMMMSQKGAAAIAVGLMISVLPGVCEELLFRGYMLRRLLQVWHPFYAIGLSSVLFAAFHFDPVHIIAVLPIGIWLGVMTWRTGTIWPAVICHTFNNALAMVMIQFHDPATFQSTIPWSVHFGLLVTAGIGTPVAFVLLAIYKRKTEPRQPQVDERCDQCGYPRAGSLGPSCPACGLAFEMGAE